MLVCIFIARPRATIAASSGLRSDLVHTDEEAIKEGGVDSIAVSLFGNVTVDTREIHIITKEQKIQIIILILKRGHCLQ